MNVKQNPRAVQHPAHLMDQDIQAFVREISSDRDGFNQLAILLTHLTGVRLTNLEKDYALMANRIYPILKTHGLTTYADYLRLIGQGNPAIIQEFVSVMTTHTTQFFRQEEQISQFVNTLPGYLRSKGISRSRELRIWCAACSTGQEAYSLLFSLREAMTELSHWEVKFLATDIDMTALERAAEGQYTNSEILSLPERYRKLYLNPVQGNLQVRGQELFEIAPEMRASIRFAPHNLLDRNYPFKHQFDFIFCRNVLYYFGQVEASNSIQRIETVLAPGGYLFVGANESGYVRLPNMERIGPAIYRKIKEP